MPELFEFDIFKKTGVYISNGTNQLSPRGAVAKLATTWNGVQECEFDFYWEERDKTVIDFTEVQPEDRIVAKFNSEIFFVGKIYDRKQHLENRVIKSKLLCFAHGRVLAERQIDRQIANGYGQQLFTQIRDDLTSPLTSKIKGISNLQTFNPLGNFDARDIHDVGLGLRKQGNTSAFDGKAGAVVFTSRSDRITKIWVYLGDPEDPVRLPVSPEDDQPLVIVPNAAPYYESITLDVSPVASQANNTRRPRNGPAYISGTNTTNATRAQYKFTNYLKEGWSEAPAPTANTFIIIFSSPTGDFQIESVTSSSGGTGTVSYLNNKFQSMVIVISSGTFNDTDTINGLTSAVNATQEQKIPCKLYTSDGSFSSHLNWNIDIGGGGAVMNVRDNIANVGNGYPISNNTSGGLGDQRVHSFVRLDYRDISVEYVDISTDDPLDVSDVTLDGNRSANGRFGIAIRKTYQTAAKVRLWLTDSTKTFTQFKAIEVFIDENEKIFVEHDGGVEEVVDYTDALFLPEGRTDFYITFEFDLRDLRVDVWIQSFIFLFTPDLANTRHLGNFKIIGRSSLSGFVTPAIISRYGVRVDRGSGNAAAGTVDIGWLSGNEIGHGGITGGSGVDLSGPTSAGFSDAGYYRKGDTYSFENKYQYRVARIDGADPGFTIGEILTAANDPTFRGEYLDTLPSPKHTPDTLIKYMHLSGSITVVPFTNTLTGVNSGIASPVIRADYAFAESLEQLQYKWALADFTDNPIVTHKGEELSICCYIDGFGAPASAPEFYWARTKSNITKMDATIDSFESTAYRLQWDLLTNDQLMFMLEQPDTWVDKFEDEDFIVDYDQDQIVWTAGSNLESGILSSNFNHHLVASLIRNVRYTQFLNEDKGGLVRNDRKMRLRDVIIEILSTIDDPLNPGNPPLLIIDKDRDGFDDETGLDLEGNSGGAPGSGYDTTEFIVNFFIGKQRTILDALRDLAHQYKGHITLTTNDAISQTVVIFEGSADFTEAVDISSVSATDRQYAISPEKVSSIVEKDFQILLDSDVGLQTNEAFSRITIKGPTPQLVVILVNQAIESSLGRRERSPEVFNKDVSLEDLQKYALALDDYYGKIRTEGSIKVSGLFPHNISSNLIDINVLIRLFDDTIDNGLDESGSGNVFKPIGITYNGEAHETELYLSDSLVNADEIERNLSEMRDVMNGIEPNVIDRDIGPLVGTDSASVPALSRAYMALFSNGIELNVFGYRRSFCQIWDQTPEHSQQSLHAYFPANMGYISNDREPIDEIRIYGYQKDVFQYAFTNGSPPMIIGEEYITTTGVSGTVVDIIGTDIYLTVKNGSLSISNTISSKTGYGTAVIDGAQITVPQIGNGVTFSGGELDALIYKWKKWSFSFVYNIGVT